MDLKSKLSMRKPVVIGVGVAVAAIAALAAAYEFAGTGDSEAIAALGKPHSAMSVPGATQALPHPAPMHTAPMNTAPQIAAGIPVPKNPVATVSSVMSAPAASATISTVSAGNIPTQQEAAPIAQSTGPVASTQPTNVSSGQAGSKKISASDVPTTGMHPSPSSPAPSPVSSAVIQKLTEMEQQSALLQQQHQKCAATKGNPHCGKTIESRGGKSGICLCLWTVCFDFIRQSGQIFRDHSIA